jgi:hypothetical protein
MRRIPGFSTVLILPAPTAIFAAFLETPGVFLRHLGSTLGTTCLGFGLAGGLGVALAVGIVYSRLLERTIYTLLVALNSIPFVSLLLLDWSERCCSSWSTMPNASACPGMSRNAPAMRAPPGAHEK